MAIPKLKQIEDRDPYAAAVMNAFDKQEAADFEALKAIGQRVGFGRSIQILGEAWGDYLEKHFGLPAQHGQIKRRIDIERIEALIRTKQHEENQPMIDRAFDIADESMLSLLSCHSLTDGISGAHALIDDNSQPVEHLGNASPALQEAVEWLSLRGIGDLIESPDGLVYMVNPEETF